MAYDTPQRVTYSFPAVAYGSGDSVRYIKGPKGLKGRIVEILGEVTTSFVGTTTPGKAQLGDGVTANKYADLWFGAAGAGTAAASAVRGTDVTFIGSSAAIKGQDPTSLPFTFLPADTQLTVTHKAPTGGSPAGVADVTFAIEWFV